MNPFKQNTEKQNNFVHFLEKECILFQTER